MMVVVWCNQLGENMKDGVCDAKNIGENGIAECQCCMEAKTKLVPRTFGTKYDILEVHNETDSGYFGTCSTFYYNFIFISFKNNSSYSKIPTSCIKILNFFISTIL